MSLRLVNIAVVFATLLACADAGAQDATIADLDAWRAQLADEFSHDFTVDGRNDDFFSVASPDIARLKYGADGLAATMTAKGPWNDVSVLAKFEIHGDFDVEVSFDQLELTGDDKSTIMLNVNFENQQQQIARVIRIREKEQPDQFQASLTQFVDGERVFEIPARKPTEVTSGRMRMVRRNNEIYYLVAEGDAAEFQMLGHITVTSDQSTANGIALQAKGNENAVARVVWKNLKISAQKLVNARQTAKQLDKRLPQLTAVFEHDFAKRGLDDRYFATLDRHRQTMRESEEGLWSSVKASGTWNGVEVAPRMEIHGDFDIEASFDSLELSGDDTSCIMMTAELKDAPQHIARLSLRHTPEKQRSLNASLSVFGDEKRVYDKPDVVNSDCLRGRLRMARRGQEITYLFAADDEDSFNLIGRRTVSDAQTLPQGIKLRTLCNGNAFAAVSWKKITIRAEKMLYQSPEEAQRQLAVMNTDGTGFRVLTGPPNGFNHLGSPEWSSDGKRITFDASLGSTNTSHVFVANADGSELEDLGPGCMPSFSFNDEEIVFTESGFGIIRMDADGSSRYRLEENGWGVQASPDGKYVAWTQSNNLILWDRETEERRALFTDGQAAVFRQITWNFAWSPDSKSIAFKAIKRSTSEEQLVVTNIEPKAEFNVVFSRVGLNADFSWHPDGKRILFSCRAVDENVLQLYTANANGEFPASLQPNQPEGLRIFDCDWSPDGSQILFSAVVDQPPVEWPIAQDGRE